MKRIFTQLTLALAAIFATTGLAAAETIPLGPIKGVTANYVAPGGPLMAYYAGSDAADNNHVFLGSQALFKNKGAGANMIGDSVSLGSFDAGTKLVFRLENKSTNKTYTTGWLNASVKSFAGGTFNGFSFPAGFLIRFEDRPFLFSDRDYNDLAFVVAPAPAPAPVPEPATMTLLGTGLAGAAAWRRRRNKKLAQ